MTKTVAVVVGDIGGCKELLGAVKLLEERGVKCLWFCDPRGKAVDVLNKNSIAFEQRLPNSDKDAVNTILIGTSATAHFLQRAWTNYGHEKNIKVFWMEDLYGTGERQAVAEDSPDVMLVIDETAKRIAQNVRPNTPTVVVGKPSFGDLALKLQRQSEIRQKVRNELNLWYASLCTYTSGGEVPLRAEAQTEMLIRQLDLWPGVVFAPRFHPKLPESLREKLYKEAEQAFGSRTVDARNVDITELVMSSDVLFSDWGCTESYVGVLARVPVGLMMFPEDPRLNDCGYQNATPPLLMTGSANNIVDEEAFDEFSFMRDITDEVIKRRKPYLPLLQPGAAINIADTVMPR